eukprot:CAMPEP_0116156452 /NCGR_PEP_ID=MMETSP0329-20121206/22841_1 /TAXON_ID=697910 /ORGANISM="Pseudo-nitzschia arenysensis, Strain B593" /LENGTH=211 /DNA_ID=CAMNT_0003653539 /DNA_START=56 /DNA_END=691 /DNA_ORIENTATION=+
MIRGSTKLLRRGMRRSHWNGAAASKPTTFMALPMTTTNGNTQEHSFHSGSTDVLRSNPLSLVCKQHQQQHQTYHLQSRNMSGCSQYFENESEYHTVADETLEDIQDAVEIAIEDNDIGGNDMEEQPEVVYASGVLNMSFPPHGTWVLNKQTPNRQIWWSSPISGPRRYEFDPESSEWVYTRSGESGSGSEETLSKAITEEFQEIYGIELDM